MIKKMISPTMAENMLFQHEYILQQKFVWGWKGVWDLVDVIKLLSANGEDINQVMSKHGKVLKIAVNKETGLVTLGADILHAIVQSRYPLDCYFDLIED